MMRMPGWMQRRLIAATRVRARIRVETVRHGQLEQEAIHASRQPRGTGQQRRRTHGVKERVANRWTAAVAADAADVLMRAMMNIVSIHATRALARSVAIIRIRTLVAIAIASVRIVPFVGGRH